MMWIVDTARVARSREGAIGPGRLVLVVGPSGAGKDTLIAGARSACADDPSVVFPQRVVTRPSSVAEKHETTSAELFAQRLAEGGFALWWDAHGNRYGIPSAIDDHIRSGRTVVCNVSRTIIGYARLRYASVVTVLVTAPRSVLEQRLAARGRPSDGDPARRMARTAELNRGEEADVAIKNVGRPAVGIRRLVAAIRDSTYFIVL